MNEAQQTPAYEGWAVVEIMGHKKLAGFVREAAQYGTAMLRVDVFGDDDKGPVATQFYGGSSIYCVTPCTEGIARAMTKHAVETPEAVRYALPAPKTCDIAWRYRTPCSPDMKAEPDPDDAGDVVCGRHALQRDAEDDRSETVEEKTDRVATLRRLLGNDGLSDDELAELRGLEQELGMHVTRAATADDSVVDARD